MRRVLAEEKAVEEFEPCDPVYTDFTPCHDPKRNLQFPRVNLEYRERHCPDPKEILMCLIPPPAGYKSPPQWPQSRDVAWYVNVPYKHLTHEKAVQNWIRYDEATEKFAFPGGGTMFANGAEAYIEDLAELIPLTDGSIRTALDTGCGVSGRAIHVYGTEMHANCSGHRLLDEQSLSSTGRAILFLSATMVQR